MTYPVGTTPDGAYDGTGGFAAYAATTQEQWTESFTAEAEAPWGDDGLLGAMYLGLAPGKPFVVALIEAIVDAVFSGASFIAETVESALAFLGSLFTGKWDEIDSASETTLTGKTIAFGSNTVSGTLAEFNTALTDTDLFFGVKAPVPSTASSAGAVGHWATDGSNYLYICTATNTWKRGAITFATW